MAEDEGATRLGVPSITEGVSLAPGATLVSGTYQIEKRLGAGGMGEVWRAHNTVTGAPCAIKVVRQELVVDGGAGLPNLQADTIVRAMRERFS